MKKLTVIVCTIVLLFTFTFVGCNDKAVGISTYFKVEEMAAGDVSRVNFGIYKIDKSADIKDVYICVRNVSDEKSSLSLYFYSSASAFISSRGGSVSLDKNYLSKTNGWVKYEVPENSVTYGYMQLVVVKTMDIGEIFVVDKNGKQAKIELVKAGWRPSDDSLSTTDNNTVKTKEQLEQSEEKNTALCVSDEQDKFDLAKINAALANADK